MTIKSFIILVVIGSIVAPQVNVFGATATVTVTSNYLTSNTFSPSFQLTGEDAWKWQSSSTLQSLSENINAQFVRFFENLYEPCSQWNMGSKTGTWDWTEVDKQVEAIFASGAEPIIVLGFYDWTSKTLDVPNGMGISSTTKLPYTDQWAAYCKAWVSHFNQLNLPVKYYEVFNEPYNYWKVYGWPAPQPQLGYFANLFNSAAVAMRSANSGIKVGNDASNMVAVMNYFVSNKIKIDYLDYHNYASSTTTDSDSDLFTSAQTDYLTDSSCYYGTSHALSIYKDATGVYLPVLITEGNLSYAYSSGTDPRIQMMTGAVYNALRIKTDVTNNFVTDVFFNFASSASSWKTMATHGYGFGMVNTDTSKPWYPYYVLQLIGSNLSVGDKVYEVQSATSGITGLSWVHGGVKNILLISTVTGQTTLWISGLSGQLSYYKVDNSISYTTPSVQKGTVNASNSITLNGYTVMLIQVKS